MFGKLGNYIFLSLIFIILADILYTEISSKLIDTLPQ